MITEHSKHVKSFSNMADKFQEFAGRFGKAPRGVGTGAKLLAAGALAVYGIKESIFTGKLEKKLSKMRDFEALSHNVAVRLTL